jgi:hypothetical protein
LISIRLCTQALWKEIMHAGALEGLGHIGAVR